jgi:hyaluronoglucosaminidase
VSALVVAWSTVACSGDFSGARSESERSGGAAADGPTTPGDPVLEVRDDPLPVVTPTPREMRWLGPDVAVSPDVDVVAADDVAAATNDAVTEALRAGGARNVRVLRPGERDRVEAPLVVNVGALGAEPTTSPLNDAGLEVPDDLPAEGYALAAFTR